MKVHSHPYREGGHLIPSCFGAAFPSSRFSAGTRVLWGPINGQGYFFWHLQFNCKSCTSGGRPRTYLRQGTPVREVAGCGRGSPLSVEKCHWKWALFYSNFSLGLRPLNLLT